MTERRDEVARRFEGITPSNESEHVRAQGDQGPPWWLLPVFIVAGIVMVWGLWIGAEDALSWLIEAPIHPDCMGDPGC